MKANGKPDTLIDYIILGVLYGYGLGFFILLIYAIYQIVLDSSY